MFEKEHAEKEVKRIENHMRKVKIRRMEKQKKKLPKNCSDDSASTDYLPEGWNNLFTVTNKRRRRFKRKYLQPKPKKSKKHRSTPNNESLDENLPEGWNGIIKNISCHSVTKVEESLFLKGNCFAL